MAISAHRLCGLTLTVHHPGKASPQNLHENEKIKVGMHNIMHIYHIMRELG